MLVINNAMSHVILDAAMIGTAKIKELHSNLPNVLERMVVGLSV